jgi:hypothetical protein
MSEARNYAVESKTKSAEKIENMDKKSVGNSKEMKK